jgi:putative ABC transport system permease protein
LSIPASRLVQSIVFGATSDIVPYAVVPVILMLVTLAAVFGPARRASTIDPMKALRDE